MKYKIKKNYGGDGGGGDPRTVETIPEWARPYIEKVGQEAVAAYDTGALSKVAAPTALQQQAFGAGAESMTQAGQVGQVALTEQQARLKQLAETGGMDELRAAQALDKGVAAAQIGQEYGTANTLGSARQMYTTAKAAGEIDAKYAEKAIQNKLAAEQVLGKSVGDTSALAATTTAGLAKLGSEQRSIEQQQADATAQGIQRLSAAVYGNPARQQAVSEGGGK